MYASGHIICTQRKGVELKTETKKISLPTAAATPSCQPAQMVAGENPKVVSERLWHASIVYLLPLPADDAEERDRAIREAA